MHANEILKALPARSEVLIVGAGPTGMALAIRLRLAGMQPLVIERLAAGLNTSRAAVIHAHTLEALEELGVGEELEERGIFVHNFRIRDRERALLDLDFTKLPSRHAHLLMLPQEETEKVLEQRLRDLGGAVFRGVTAVAVSQTADSVFVEVETEAGHRTLEAMYVVGADGMQSVVRRASGTEFAGESYEDPFVLADVRMDWPIEGEVSQFFAPEGLVVVAPLPHGRYRVVAAVENAPEKPSVQDIERLLAERGPRGWKARVQEVIWSSRFRVHHRVARRYRVGRLFLMGDAAHVHSPAGGQGMNTGLVDAVVLGALLASVLRGGRSEAVLDAYERLRRPAAEKVLALSARLTRVATVAGRGKRRLRNLVFALLNRIAPAKRRLLLALSGLDRKEYAETA